MRTLLALRASAGGRCNCAVVVFASYVRVSEVAVSIEQRQAVIELQHGAVQRPRRTLQRHGRARRAQNQAQRGQTPGAVAGASTRASAGGRCICAVVVFAV